MISKLKAGMKSLFQNIRDGFKYLITRVDPISSEEEKALQELDQLIEQAHRRTGTLPIPGLIYQLDLHILGSCNCMTKTPDPEYHAKTCKYARLSRAKKLLEAIESSGPELGDPPALKPAPKISAINLTATSNTLFTGVTTPPSDPFRSPEVFNNWQMAAQQAGSKTGVKVGAVEANQDSNSAGTPSARFHAFLVELEKRFRHVSPISARAPEGLFLEEIDITLAELRALKQYWVPLLPADMNGLSGQYWLALNDGSVTLGECEWEELGKGEDGFVTYSLSADGFTTYNLGRVGAKSVSHVMKCDRPEHPLKRSFPSLPKIWFKQ